MLIIAGGETRHFLESRFAIASTDKAAKTRMNIGDFFTLRPKDVLLCRGRELLPRLRQQAGSVANTVGFRSSISMSNLPNAGFPGQLHVNAEGFIVRDHAPHPTRSAIMRFLEKIRVSPIIPGELAAPCWEWMGCISRNGYGQFKVDARRGSTRKTGPHVYSYEYFNGTIPDGFEVHHLCYVRHCCNPLHLTLKTHQENVTDADSTTRPAINAQKTECSRGHSLSGSNLHIKTNGSRQCRACNALRQREFQAKRKARITQTGDATESLLSDATAI